MTTNGLGRGYGCLAKCVCRSGAATMFSHRIESGRYLRRKAQAISRAVSAAVAQWMHRDYRFGTLRSSRFRLSRGALRVSLPARQGCVSSHGDYVSAQRAEYLGPARLLKLAVSLELMLQHILNPLLRFRPASVRSQTR